MISQGVTFFRFLNMHYIPEQKVTIMANTIGSLMVMSFFNDLVVGPIGMRLELFACMQKDWWR